MLLCNPGLSRFRQYSININLNPAFDFRIRKTSTGTSTPHEGKAQG